jgi:hypothetical protein
MWFIMDKVRLQNRVICIQIIDTFNSIIPCLALRGVAASIARSRSLRAKVLLCEFHPFFTSRGIDIGYALVNAKNDRETDGYTAVDYIQYALDMVLDRNTYIQC